VGDQLQHSLLHKYDETYDGTGLFCKESIAWLRSLRILEHDRLILDGNLHVLEAVSEQIKAVDIQIANEAVNQDQVKLLMSMSGVDYYSAMIILSEIGDVKRFSGPCRLRAWAGLVRKAEVTFFYDLPQVSNLRELAGLHDSLKSWDRRRRGNSEGLGS
jgi:hypothetical protein